MSITPNPDPTAAVEVFARLLCAADVHVHGDDHPTWQQMVGEPGQRIRDDYRKAAAWLLPRMTVGARSSAVSVVPPATNQTAEEHRLALSEALGLGTGAPWDAIHDRVTELGLPPLDRDPVARRLGLLAAYRAAVLTEAADLVAALDRRKTVIAADTIKDAWEEGRDEGADLLRRLAAEAPHTETPDGALSPRCDHCQRPGHSFEDCPDADAPAVVAQPGKETTPCSTPNACDPDDGPCERHEREQSHAENDHSLCRRAECEVLRQS